MHGVSLVKGGGRGGWQAEAKDDGERAFGVRTVVFITRVLRGGGGGWQAEAKDLTRPVLVFFLCYAHLTLNYLIFRGDRICSYEFAGVY